LKLVCNVNIVYGNLKYENSSRLCPETSTKLYVHEFGFCREEGGAIAQGADEINSLRRGRVGSRHRRKGIYRVQ
jgi:hypothetical protein